MIRVVRLPAPLGRILRVFTRGNSGR